MKNAALGLRQNIRRSSRYWRQARPPTRRRGARLARAPAALELGASLARSAPGRRPRGSGGHAQLLEPLAARQRRAGQLVQQRRSGRRSRARRSPSRVALADPVARARRAPSSAGGPSARIRAVLDDRHAVGQRLRLVEVVRGQQDRLAELAQRRGSCPRRRAARRGRSRSSARRGRSARGRRRAPARGRAAAAGRPTACRARASCLAVEPGERDHLARRRAGAGRAPPSARPPRARVDVAVDAACSAARSRPARAASRGRARPGRGPAPRPRRRCARGSPRGSRRSSSCPPRWARAGRTPRRGATSKSMPAHGLELAVGLAQAVAPRSAVRVTVHHGNMPSCGRIGSAPASTSARTRRACSSPSVRGRARCARSSSERAFTRIGKGMRPGGEIPREKIAEVARVVAEQARARARARRDARCASVAHRRDPRRAEPRRVRGRRGRCGRRATRGARAARRRRGWRSSAPRARSPGALDGTLGGGRRRRRLDRGRRSARWPRGVSWSASFRVGSGLLADVYLRSDPPVGGSCARVREHADGVFARLDAAAPPTRAVAVGGSAASLRRLVGAGSSARRAATGAPVLGRRPGGRRGASVVLDRPRAGAAAAGRACWSLDAAAHRLGQAAADRPRRVCARASSSSMAQGPRS